MRLICICLLSSAEEWVERLSEMRQQKLAGYPDWFKLCSQSQNSQTNNVSSWAFVSPEAQQILSSLYRSASLQSLGLWTVIVFVSQASNHKTHLSKIINRSLWKSPRIDLQSNLISFLAFIFLTKPLSILITFSVSFSANSSPEIICIIGWLFVQNQ